MAGHSKGANIRHYKGTQDTERARVYSRHIRETTLAFRCPDGGDLGNTQKVYSYLDISDEKMKRIQN